jgi:hypothetical protein
MAREIDDPMAGSEDGDQLDPEALPRQAHVASRTTARYELQTTTYCSGA